LRSQLMKLGLGHEEVMKMLDKTELEATLSRLTQHKARMETYHEIESYWQETLTTLMVLCYENVYTIIIGFVIFMCVFIIPRDYIFGVRLFVYDYVTGYIFPIKSKVKAIKKAWKYNLKYSFLCLLIAMLIEVYEMTIHITMPLGWILRYTSPIRKFFPTTLYIPLSMQMIKKDLPSYGMVCRYMYECNTDFSLILFCTLFFTECGSSNHCDGLSVYSRQI
jgi:hypothetical protein